MNRLLVMLVSIVLGSALPGGAVAEGERGSAAGVTQLILLFLSDVSRGLLPKRVVAPDKDWKIVRDAEQEHDARRSQEERRRDAYQRLEEQERQARKAREEYRRDVRNMLGERHYAGHRYVDEQERDARKAREERLRVAERRVNEREWAAQKAKEDYQRVARMAREERRREAEEARHGG